MLEETNNKYRGICREGHAERSRGLHKGYIKGSSGLCKGGTKVMQR